MRIRTRRALTVIATFIAFSNLVSAGHAREVVSHPRWLSKFSYTRQPRRAVEISWEVR